MERVITRGRGNLHRGRRKNQEMEGMISREMGVISSGSEEINSPLLENKCIITASPYMHHVPLCTRTIEQF